MPHLDRDDVTEVTINYPGVIFVRTRHEWEEHEAPALNMAYITSLTTAIAVFNGKNPGAINSVVLPGGQRGQIVRDPAVIDGSISCRSESTRRLRSRWNSSTRKAHFPAPRWPIRASTVHLRRKRLRKRNAAISVGSNRSS